MPYSPATYSLGAGLKARRLRSNLAFAFALNDMFNGNSIDKFELARIGQSTGAQLLRR